MKDAETEMMNLIAYESRRVHLATLRIRFAQTTLQRLRMQEKANKNES